jgi:hypothetical protein
MAERADARPLQNYKQILGEANLVPLRDARHGYG